MTDEQKERERRYKALSAYVRHRLTAECAPYKAKSKLAKRIGFSPTTISSIIRQGQAVGDRLLDALCIEWKTTRNRLFKKALAWSAEQEQAELREAS